MIAPAAVQYLRHFQLQELPFTLTPNTEFYCGLSAHQAALNVLLVSLYNNEGFIKVVGEVGTGKTLLCRKLLNQLEGDFFTAYILNPNLTPVGLFKNFASELGLEVESHWCQQQLQEKISDRLMSLYQAGQRVVLIIDEVQTMPVATLEALRLLTNLETESHKLLQIVLFGQPELDELLQRKDLRQLTQRITFSHHLNTITRQELAIYLSHRLTMAGHTRGDLFTRKANKLLFRASKGVPRIINILSHKALLSAYGRNKKLVDRKSVLSAIDDSRGVVLRKSRVEFYLLMVILLFSVSIIIIFGVIFEHIIKAGLL